MTNEQGLILFIVFGLIIGAVFITVMVCFMAEGSGRKYRDYD